LPLRTSNAAAGEERVLPVVADHRVVARTPGGVLDTVDVILAEVRIGEVDRGALGPVGVRDHVRARPAVDGVTPAPVPPAVEEIVVALAIELVLALNEADCVHRLAVQLVVSVASQHEVGPVVAGQRVVAGAAEEVLHVRLDRVALAGLPLLAT
jgi:hypothetical protein